MCLSTAILISILARHMQASFHRVLLVPVLDCSAAAQVAGNTEFLHLVDRIKMTMVARSRRQRNMMLIRVF